ncbi:uncharacterized protein VTP21DRAFT_11139 [Calcarisporiella thermophila]|uniref:uncharacterized protein n=1 Tax=Calcarisporiella thermophila TaxID=911321 RepID=UPI00374457BE
MPDIIAHFTKKPVARYDHRDYYVVLQSDPKVIRTETRLPSQEEKKRVLQNNPNYRRAAQVYSFYSMR